jgi:hypothetical protein
MENKDVTFIVHKEWLTAIQSLPLEQQDAVIGDLIRYGTGLLPAHKEDPVISSMVNLVKNRIDYSKEKYAQKVQGGNKSGKKKKYTDTMIYNVAKDYVDDVSAVAEILGCSLSTINHSEGWRRRKEKDVIFED